ncbi:MAG: CspA family cold shock protein [Acidisphaera sp.]|nr:CspA family cold shock protein [Acidisphaera sp.]
MPHPDRRAFQSRRRGFDDDQPPSFGGDRGPRREPSFATPTGPIREAKVKWFNGEKGFGFVQMTDGSGEVFLHSSVLRRAGYDVVSEGATLEVRTGQGQKGLQVSEVLSVDESTAAPSAPRGAGGPRSSYAGGGGGGGGGGGMRGGGGPVIGEVTGTVKWFNTVKGFGFIQSDQGGKDIFIHISTLERAGLKSLGEGQAVRVQVRQGAKGPEAAEISLA